MLTIGVCDSHDSGGVVLDDNNIIFAVNEERLNRKKLTRTFPKLSLQLISKYKCSTVVVSSSFSPILLVRIFRDIFGNELKTSHFSYLFNLNMLYQILLRKTKLSRVESFLTKYYFELKMRRNIAFIDHHNSHASSAYYTSGVKKALIFTMDGIGDGLSVTVNIGKDNIIKRIYSEPGSSAISSYFSRWTEYLGFRPNKDEGKISGLAAYGKSDKLLPIIKKFFFFHESGFNKINYVLPNKITKYKKLNKYTKRDIAAAIQENFEKEITKFVKYWINKTGITDICLAGGTFLNVKLNQRIHELDEVRSIYIFPHMGDGGLAFGAALAKIKPNPFRFSNLYFGPEFSKKEIKDLLDRLKLGYKECKNIEKEISRLLVNEKIVARFSGRMEYGPRALGNRSILFRPDKQELIRKLNKMLKRTEFMPFAPVILEKYAGKCLKNTKGAEYTAKFMTITFDCTDWMKQKCPAAIHVDGTARPQILSKYDSPSFYNIIENFKRITSIPVIMNTSFNMHGEPIVCSPKDAIRTFKKAKLDYLAIGNYLIKS